VTLDFRKACLDATDATTDFSTCENLFLLLLFHVFLRITLVISFLICALWSHSCRYCSRLYCDQLALNGVNVCDWCVDLEEKQKIQSHKRKVQLRKPESRKIKVVATIEKPKKINAKPTLKVPVKLEGSKHNQALSLIQGCKLSAKSGKNLLGNNSSQSSPTKSPRYKLLSDVLRWFFFVACNKYST